MLLELRLAFRNLWRNPRPTILTLLVISLGTTAWMFTDALMTGMQRMVIDMSTKTFLGQAQIHHPDFMLTQDSAALIEDPTTAQLALASEPTVKSWAPRVVLQGTLNSSANLSPSQVYGIDLEKEAKVSRISEAIISGQAQLGQHDILIGYRLADILQVDTGDKLVLTSSQAQTGQLVQHLFRVKGIFRFNLSHMDEYVAFISLGVGQKLLNVGSQIHELALQVAFDPKSQNTNSRLVQRFKDQNLDYQSWMQLLPELKSLLDMFQYSDAFIGMIIFALVLLMIINSSFMSIYERYYEFGVIRSLGQYRTGLFRIIMFECFALGFWGALIGIVLGTLLNLWFAKEGIGFAESQFVGLVFSEPIKGVMRSDQYVSIPLMILCISTLSGLYPAYYASRLQPTKAMRQ